MLNPQWSKAVTIKAATGENVIGIPLLTSDSIYVELNFTTLNRTQYGIIKKYNWASKSLKLYTGSGNLYQEGVYDATTGNASSMQGMGGYNIKKIMDLENTPIQLNEVTITGPAPQPGTPTAPIFNPFPIGPVAPQPGYGGNNGNNGNGDYGGNTQSYPPLEVLDSVQNPCIKSGLNLALNANTTIRNMLNSEFGSYSYFGRDIVFYDVVSLPDTVAGTAYGYNSYSFVISLNRNTLPQRSREYIFSTIYHEVLHAYMNTQISKDATGKYLISNQHETMANQYIILLTGALKLAFPSISDHDAWALSWGGLEETPFYKTKLTEDQRTEIKSVGNKHRKSTEAGMRRGTYCN